MQALRRRGACARKRRQNHGKRCPNPADQRWQRRGARHQSLARQHADQPRRENPDVRRRPRLRSRAFRPASQRRISRARATASHLGRDRKTSRRSNPTRTRLQSRSWLHARRRRKRKFPAPSCWRSSSAPTATSATSTFWRNWTRPRRPRHHRGQQMALQTSHAWRHPRGLPGKSRRQLHGALNYRFRFKNEMM